MPSMHFFLKFIRQILKFIIMKKISFITVILSMVFFIFSSCDRDALDESIELNQSVEAQKKDNAKNNGFDEYGYNWNAHHFNGILLNAIIGDYINQGAPFWKMGPYTGDDDTYLIDHANEIENTIAWSNTWDPPAPWFWYYIWGFRHVNLVMHWNDALISREGIYPATWFDSNGWITFHYSGIEENNKWSEFQKMVAARSTDILIDGIWYDEYGTEIGIECDYKDLILIQVIEIGDVPAYMYYPAYHNPTSSGLGKYKLR